MKLWTLLRGLREEWWHLWHKIHLTSDACVGGVYLEVLEVLTLEDPTLTGLIASNSFHHEDRIEESNGVAHIVGDDLVGACEVACVVTLMGCAHQICERNGIVCRIVSILTGSSSDTWRK
jgi:hypothetical protein